MKFFISILLVLLFFSNYFINCEKICLGYYNEERGKLLFGNQFEANYTYVKIGSTVTMTINSFLVDDYLNFEGVKSLSAVFNCGKNRHCNTNENGIGFVTTGYCYTNQQQMLISYYYFKNQYIYIQLLSPNLSKCNKFQVFGTTLVWNVNQEEEENNNDKSDEDSDDSSFDPNKLIN
ncbi:hypothetical protein DICPUDRAFT_78676 [Dictyostelium purpureum]|uniref:Reelin domain-containing protein n=1 Tax=Dictyostelium purpureum TaxID=5786 RepID=F0ZK80_DICPU|nr:uncharacterized protein DICPUDRAFT_78676 [Dictyostelium purpureum]EGC35639.1 hypothetical protein DICPUDRAFT_78676 [Dictyostelium purpureum]|eukprot:XP_003287818.1 hypothetical protein DICPUDRAFT_78676 [Dictyostelium purpureum]